MFLSIDPESEVPIYEQIVRQVKFAIAEKTLRPGQLMPSVRLLSQQLAINPNTVARAYLQLQTDEVVEPLRGRGLVVCTGAAARCRAFRQALIAERIGAVFEEALQGGITVEALQELVEKQMRKAARGVAAARGAEPPEKTESDSSLINQGRDHATE